MGVKIILRTPSLSELLLSTIEPIDHQVYQPLSPLTIKPIDLLSYFVTFKPFGWWEVPQIIGTMAAMCISDFERRRTVVAHPWFLVLIA